MIHALPSADLPQNIRLFLLPIVGNDDVDRLADDFFGLVAEYPLSSLVPCGNDSFQRLADDRIVGDSTIAASFALASANSGGILA